MCSPFLTADSYHERAVIAKLYRIVQSSADDRKMMIPKPIGRERTLATSSKLWVRTRRSPAVHTVSVDSGNPEARREHERPDDADTETHIVCKVADQCTQLELDALSHRKPMSAMWLNFRLPVMSSAAAFNIDWS